MQVMIAKSSLKWRPWHRFSRFYAATSASWIAYSYSWWRLNHGVQDLISAPTHSLQNRAHLVRVVRSFSPPHLLARPPLPNHSRSVSTRVRTQMISWACTYAQCADVSVVPTER